MGGFTHQPELHLSTSPAGYHPARKAATFSHTTASPISPPLNAKSHKHYHSHSNTFHPNQPLEHINTSSTNDSAASSPDSYSSPHNRHHRLSNIVSSIPNPLKMTTNTIEDHVSEFRYQHNARAAKREASRSSQHEHSRHMWSPTTESASSPEYEEVVEDWKERDEQAWAEEVRKRELARRRTTTQSEGHSGWWTIEQATEELPGRRL